MGSWFDAAADAVTKWRRIGKLATILMLALAVIFVVGNLGFSDEVDETRSGVLILQTGEEIPCQVHFTGTVTRYLLNQDRYHPEDTVRVSVNDRLAATFLYYEGNGNYFYHHNTARRETGIMDRDRELLLVELDAKMLLPEQADQRCILALPAESAAEIKGLLKTAEVPELYKNSFLWLTEE